MFQSDPLVISAPTRGDYSISNGTGTLPNSQGSPRHHIVSVHLCTVWNVLYEFAVCLFVGGVAVLHLIIYIGLYCIVQRLVAAWITTYVHVIYEYDFFLSFFPPFSTPLPPPPPVAPLPTPLSPQLMQSCGLCYVDTQTTACLHYFCVPCCVC